MFFLKRQLFGQSSFSFWEFEMTYDVHPLFNNVSPELLRLFLCISLFRKYKNKSVTKCNNLCKSCINWKLFLFLTFSLIRKLNSENISLWNRGQRTFQKKEKKNPNMWTTKVPAVICTWRSKDLFTLETRK